LGLSYCHWLTVILYCHCYCNYNCLKLLIELVIIFAY
jgi:hypothetical protein